MNITKVLGSMIASLFLVSLVNASDFEFLTKTTEKKVIAISFDDGPSRGTTSKILDELEKRNLRATFFVLGEMALVNQSVLSRMVVAGNEVGNHTYNHSDLVKGGVENAKEQMRVTSEIIYNATRKLPVLMRPPGGVVNQSVVQVAKGLGLQTVIWSLDPQDWKHRNAKYVADYVLKNALSGDVILLHDTHSTTADAVPIILDGLILAGYTFVTVSEMLEINQNLAIGNGIPWYKKARETFPALIKAKLNEKKAGRKSS